MTIEIIDRKTLYSGYLTIESVKVRLPDGAEVVREDDRSGGGRGHGVTARGAPGEEENITVNERSLESLSADLDAAHIDNALLLHLVMALRLRHPELFL